MTSLTVDLDDDAAERLSRQAELEGVTPAELAGSSDALRGEQADERLAEHRFG